MGQREKKVQGSYAHKKKEQKCLCPFLSYARADDAQAKSLSFADAWCFALLGWVAVAD